MGDGVGQIILCIKRYRCQKTKIIDLLHDKSAFIRKTVTLCFSAPLWGLGATYTVHLRLIGKPVVDFLLVIIELYPLGAMGQALRANIDWKLPFLKGVSHFGSTFQVEGVVPTNHLRTVR